MTAYTARQKTMLKQLQRWGDTWVRPLDVGGHDRSHHSKVLNSLVVRGFAESKQRGPKFDRGSKVYRITPLGVLAVGEIEVAESYAKGG